LHIILDGSVATCEASLADMPCKCSPLLDCMCISSRSEDLGWLKVAITTSTLRSSTSCPMATIAAATSSRGRSSLITFPHHCDNPSVDAESREHSVLGLLFLDFPYFTVEENEKASIYNVKTCGESLSI
jgi:hypothetical protein